VPLSFDECITGIADLSISNWNFYTYLSAFATEFNDSMRLRATRIGVGETSPPGILE